MAGIGNGNEGRKAHACSVINLRFGGFPEVVSAPFFWDKAPYSHFVQHNLSACIRPHDASACP